MDAKPPGEIPPFYPEALPDGKKRGNGNGPGRTGRTGTGGGLLMLILDLLIENQGLDTSAAAFDQQIKNQQFCSVAEMADAGKHHGQSQPVGRLDDFRVAL